MKKILLLLTVILGFGACCDCFDESDYDMHFQFTNESDTNTIYWIITEKGNLSHPLDTIFSRASAITLDGTRDADYIIRRDTPFFEHYITEINIEGKSKGPCKCINITKMDFKFDGIQKTMEDLPFQIPN